MCCCDMNINMSAMKMSACRHLDHTCHLANEQYIILIMMCHMLHVFKTCSHNFCLLLRRFVVHLFLRRSESFKCFKYRRKADKRHFLTYSRGVVFLA